MKTKTSELIGPALDWAVAMCEGLKFEWDSGASWVYPAEFAYYKPALGARQAKSLRSFGWSRHWTQGGPIIEREKLAVSYEGNGVWFGGGYDGCVYKENFAGPTPLIAAMRCYVASKLGNTVDVPEELL